MIDSEMSLPHGERQEFYLREASFENAFTLRFTLDAMTETELPSACLACGECKQVCPQGIDIPDVMKKFAETIAKLPRMGPPPMPAKPAGSAR
jgi:Fe-S oxidoreductase